MLYTSLDLIQRHPLQAILIVAFGCGLALVFSYLKEDKLKFGYLSLLFLFISTPFIGNMAGYSAGMRTVQISGGRDPEYETEKVREVPVVTRYRLEQKYGDASFGLFAISAALTALLLLLLNRIRGSDDKRVYELRAAGVMLMMFTWLFLSRALEG